MALNRIKNAVILFNSSLKFVVAYALTRTKEKQNDLFLIGSGYGGHIDENAQSLFDYIKRTGKQVYLISNHPINTENQLKRASLKTYINFFLAQCVFYSHSLSDVLPNMHRGSLLVNACKRPKLVFIQHGVIGLKKDLNDKSSMRDYILGLSKTFDLMIVSSEQEKSIVEAFGVDKSKIVVTGLPRFDKLKPIVSKTVMVFFTWKDINSYDRKVQSLKSTGGYQDLLKHGFTIKIIDHPMVNRIRGRRVTNLNGHIHEVINDSCLLITDDSSIAWDFFYKKSKVIFYHPSDNWLMDNNSKLKQFIASNDVEFDSHVEAFLKGLINSNFAFSKYNDKNNSARVFNLA